ncbi:MAG: hypothetical protein HZB56_09160 [Deltaproteobacteria bacterium]|nr:hypothetical protein [Deltaproteobacteria bacterium]
MRTTVTANRREHPWIAFALGAAAILLTSRAVVASAAFRTRPSLFSTAVVLDLTLTGAALAWVTLVRTRRIASGSLLAIVSAGLFIAARLLPPGEAAGFARPARVVVPLAELGLLVWIGHVVLRARSALRARGSDLPWEDLAREAVRQRVGQHRGLDALITELSFVGMAFFSWRSAPHVPPGAQAFTVHRTSGAGAVAGALLLAGASETLAAHVLLSRWSVTAAWTATALSLWLVIWLVGDLRGLKLRPVLLEGDVLRVRIGLRWRAGVPLKSIRTICPGPDPVRHRSCAVASVLGSPNLYLHLDGPAELAGPLGLRRRGQSLGLRVDDPGALRGAIAAHRPDLA